jgi:hypothetical protein
MAAPRQAKPTQEEAGDAILVSVEEPVMHAPVIDLSERVITIHRATGCGKVELCVMRHLPI